MNKPQTDCAHNLVFDSKEEEEVTKGDKGGGLGMSNTHLMSQTSNSTHLERAYVTSIMTYTQKGQMSPHVCVQGGLKERDT